MGCFDSNRAPKRLRLGLNNIYIARWEGIVANDTYIQVFENVEAIGDTVYICLCVIYVYVLYMFMCTRWSSMP